MTVRNWLFSNHEKVQYISPDGVKYNMHDPAKKSILSMTGWGLPAAEIAETRGPFQHGSDPLTIRIPKREISMNIRHNGCDRNEYWSNRLGLIDALRLNRTSVNNPSPGHLKWFRSDGTIRQVDVFITYGPNFNLSQRGWDEHSYQDTLKFLAHNPIIYDPSQITSIFTNLGCDLIQQLVFPVTIGTSGFLFGLNQCNAINTRTINYAGNWQEYPLITVRGPARNFKITNTETGLFVLLEYVIKPEEQVTFDLRYGRKTVFNNYGENLLGYISTDSDLGSFALEPDPIVPNGINTFETSIDNGNNTDTQVILKYYNRYIGI